jgi:hypothetical protein
LKRQPYDPPPHIFAARTNLAPFSYAATKNIQASLAHL